MIRAYLKLTALALYFAFVVPFHILRAVLFGVPPLRRK